MEGVGIVVDLLISFMKSFQSFAQEYFTVLVPCWFRARGSFSEPFGTLYTDVGLFTVLCVCFFFNYTTITFQNLHTNLTMFSVHN